MPGNNKRPAPALQNDTMENKSHAFITGLFTLVLIAAAIWAGVWFNRDRTERIPYLLASNQALSGLNPQAPVRYRGLMVGRVKQISFDPKVKGQILVEIGVSPDTPITASTYASLGYQGVTGIAFVQLDDDGSKPQSLPSSAEKMARIPLRPGSFQQLEQNARQILAQSEELTRRANALLALENQQKVFETLERFGKAADAFQRVPQQLQPTLERLPAVADAAQTSLHSINQLSQDTRALSKNLNNLALRLQAPDSPVFKLGQNLDQIHSLTSEVEQETLPRINTLGDEAKTSLRALHKGINQFNDRPQSIIFGNKPAQPGPGEPGFVEPGK